MLAFLTGPGKRGCAAAPSRKSSPCLAEWLYLTRLGRRFKWIRRWDRIYQVSARPGGRSLPLQAVHHFGGESFGFAAVLDQIGGGDLLPSMQTTFRPEKTVVLTPAKRHAKIRFFFVEETIRPAAQSARYCQGAVSVGRPGRLWFLRLRIEPITPPPPMSTKAMGMSPNHISEVKPRSSTASLV